MTFFCVLLLRIAFLRRNEKPIIALALLMSTVWLLVLENQLESWSKEEDLFSIRMARLSIHTSMTFFCKEIVTFKVPKVPQILLLTKCTMGFSTLIGFVCPIESFLVQSNAPI